MELGYRVWEGVDLGGVVERCCEVNMIKIHFKNLSNFKMGYNKKVKTQKMRLRHCDQSELLLKKVK